MSASIVGRKEEQKILAQALQAQEAELIAITGRRRVGKTFLVTSVYHDHFAFELTAFKMVYWRHNCKILPTN